MSSPLACQRDRFSLPEDVHYLNCAYMSPLPREVEEVGREGLRRLRCPTRIGPDDFFDESDALRRRFARLVGAAEPERVSIVPAVSYGIAVAARNLPLSAGQNVVVAAGQFPSNVYAWSRRCREEDAEVRVVGPGAGGARDGGRGERWNRRLLEAVDAGTAAVALSHVHWTDGTLFRLEAVRERADEVGAALVVDGTQSVGALPFDVGRIRPDALVCAGYKWLLGPYTVGMGWYGPRFDDGVPLEETWLGRRGSEDFAGLVDYVEEYQPGAVRYDVGERSNFVLVPMQRRALDMVLEWGPERVQAYCGELTRELVEEARELGLGVEREGDRAAHLFGLRLPEGAEPAALEGELEREEVAVSVRGDAVRVSPNVYNDAEDVAALRRVLRRRFG